MSDHRSRVVVPNALTLLGVLAFLAPWVGGGWIRRAVPAFDTTAAIVTSGAGLATGLLGLLLEARARRRSWRRVPAVCVERFDGVGYDRESDPEGGHSWAIRVVCEAQIDGQTVRTQPAHWCTFPTRGTASAFLDRVIDAQGCCTLRIDPRPPHQSEFATGGPVDRLLNWPFVRDAS